MKKLHRSLTDRIFMGVCGGISETYGINSILVRAVFVMLALLSPIFITLYFFAGMLMPVGAPGDTRPGDDGIERGYGYRKGEEPFDTSNAQDVDVDIDDSDDERM